MLVAARAGRQYDGVQQLQAIEAPDLNGPALVAHRHVGGGCDYAVELRCDGKAVGVQLRVERIRGVGAADEIAHRIELDQSACCLRVSLVVLEGGEHVPGWCAVEAVRRRVRPGSLECCGDGRVQRIAHVDHPRLPRGEPVDDQVSAGRHEVFGMVRSRRPADGDGGQHGAESLGVG